jgi:hypothetical protein
VTSLDDAETTRAVIDRLVAPDSHRSENLPPDDWRAACRFCARHFPYLTKWQLKFIAELARNKAPPSGKQLTILENLVTRCRNEAG